MKLVIVESPTKTKSISKYLGNGYQVMATMGHIRDLPKSKIGVEVEKNEFTPDYEVVRGRGEQVSKLKKAAKTADQIILATDPDREGEAIAWHTAAVLGEKNKTLADKFVRVVFHSITKDAIIDAMQKPREIDMNLVDAQQARRVLDRLVGYKLSPLLWRKVRRGLSAGRVQSVAVRLIVEREKEIEAFVPEEYWQVRVELSPEGKDKFWVELLRADGKKLKVGNAEKAAKVDTDLKIANYRVSAIIRKERRVRPHPPFKTSTLQQAAANVLGWSSKKTMSVAQKLYEQGNITYHRTDSLNLVGSAVDQVREFINGEWGANYLPAQARFYKTSGKVVAQEAHEAIRPTNFNVGPNTFKGQGQMAGDQEKLYNLIWRRTLACQMADAVFDTTRVEVEASGKEHKYGLAAQGEIVKFDGWRRLYKKEDSAVLLPELSKGETLEFKQLKKEQKFTQPPARYNDASLVKELEKRGIGRPSTYAPTISTIIERRYVDRKDRRFFPTAIGVAVTQFLTENFPKEMDYEFTAKMEDQLDEIAQGGLKWIEMLKKFYGLFEKQVKDAEKTSQRVGVQAESTGEKCPTCGEGEIVIREGRYGKFYSCSRFPECKYTARLTEYLEGAKCEKCGGKVVVKRTRTGREFYGCENYPKCKWASWKKPKVENASGTEGSGVEEPKVE